VEHEAVSWSSFFQVARMGSYSDVGGGGDGGGDPCLPPWSHGEEENKIW